MMKLAHINLEFDWKTNAGSGVEGVVFVILPSSQTLEDSNLHTVMSAICEYDCQKCKKLRVAQAHVRQSIAL